MKLHVNWPRRRTMVLLAAGIGLCAGAGAFYVCMWAPTAQAPQAAVSKQYTVAAKPSVAAQSAKPAGQLTFAAMGDMLAHDSIVAQGRTASGYDFKPYFAHIRPLYSSADAVFCNPETLATGEAYGISGYPSFNAPTEFARDLVAGAGCTVINMASNHTNDKGQDALNADIDVWDKLSLLARSGANRSAEEQMQVHYFTKNGIKVAFIALADYSNNTALTSYGVNIYHNDQLVQTLLSEARRQADAVVVSAHWGTEDSSVVNDDQRAAAQRFADLGADVVIGTGPHVLQPVTYLSTGGNRKTLVWYSIGNMLSAQLKADELTGIIAGFTLTKQSTGGVSVSNPTALATFMSYDWPAADRAAGNLTTRSNLTLRPLSSAGDAPAQMFGSGYSVAERLEYVRQILGTDAGVKISD